MKNPLKILVGALLVIATQSTHCIQKEPINLAIFVSGTGSNMEAILDNKIEGIKLCIVISNKEDAPALAKAQSRGIPTTFIDSDASKNPTPKAYSEKLIACLKDHKVTPENGLICLAGFMKILDPTFVRHFSGRILNLHPSLLPSFKGLHGPRQALEYGVKITGCTVHFVDEGLDTGPIILQAAVSITEDETEDTLQKKIQLEEHRIYSEAIKLFVQKRLIIEGRCVKILPMQQATS